MKSFALCNKNKTFAIEQDRFLSGTDKVKELSILFIDDEELLLQCWDQMFTRSGFIVHKASTEREAAEVFNLNMNDIDVVVIDVNFGEISGFDVYSALTCMKQDFRVIFTSAAMELPEKSIVKNGEQTPFIRKPFFPEELAQLIDSLYGDEIDIRRKLECVD